MIGLDYKIWLLQFFRTFVPGSEALTVDIYRRVYQCMKCFGFDHNYRKTGLCPVFDTRINMKRDELRVRGYDSHYIENQINTFWFFKSICRRCSKLGCNEKQCTGSIKCINCNGCHAAKKDFRCKAFRKACDIVRNKKIQFELNQNKRKEYALKMNDNNRSHKVTQRLQTAFGTKHTANDQLKFVFESDDFLSFLKDSQNTSKKKGTGIKNDFNFNDSAVQLSNKSGNKNNFNWNSHSNSNMIIITIIIITIVIIQIIIHKLNIILIIIIFKIMIWK